MLSETMQRVQEAEKQAEKIRFDAEEKAAAIVDDARAAAEQRKAKALSRAEEEAKAAIADARRAGEEERKQYASSVNEQLAKDQKLAYARADEAVEALIAGLV